MWRVPGAKRRGRREGLPWRRPGRREIVCRRMVQLIRRMKWWRKRAGRRLGRLANGWRETEKRVFQLASSTPPSVELLASSWTRRSSILLISACQNKSKSYQKVVGVLWWLTTTAPMFPSASTHSSFSIFFHISVDSSTREFNKRERGFYAMTYKWEASPRKQTSGTCAAAEKHRPLYVDNFSWTGRAKCQMSAGTI